MFTKAKNGLACNQNESMHLAFNSKVCTNWLNQRVEISYSLFYGDFLEAP